jgi:type I restriction enzyme, S subunit
MNNGLPKNWIIIKIKDFFKVETGSTPRTTIDEYWNNGKIKWITPKDLGKQKSKFINYTDRCITDSGLKSCSASYIQPESIIISTRAPIGYISILKDWMSFNQGCKGLVPLRGSRSKPVNFHQMVFNL